MQLVIEWFPNVKLRKVDTPFRNDSAYEKYLMASVTMLGGALFKYKHDYHGNFGHTIGRIQKFIS